VPIAMGSQSYEASRALGVALAKLAKAEAWAVETLVLASSDFAYHSRNERRGSTAGSQRSERGTTSVCRATSVADMGACGGAPMVRTYDLRRTHGSQPGAVLKYATPRHYR